MAVQFSSQTGKFNISNGMSQRRLLACNQAGASAHCPDVEKLNSLPAMNGGGFPIHVPTVAAKNAVEFAAFC
jgi:hypothetical protein